LALTHNNLALLRRRTGQVPEASASYRDALAILRQLVTDFPTKPDFRRVLGHTHNNLGNLLQQTGRLPEAEAAYRDALAIRRPLATDFPAEPEFRRDLAQTNSNLAILLGRTGRLLQAEAAYRDALANVQRLATQFPSSTEYQSDLAVVLGNLAENLNDQKQHGAARPLIEQAIPLYQGVLAANPNSPQYRAFYRDYLGIASQTWLGLADHHKATEIATELARQGDASPKDIYDAARFLSRCVPLAENDTNRTEANRSGLAQKYADGAMDLLQRAVQRGYKDADAVKKAPDLDALRPRADFQKLLAELTSVGPPKP
jgi:tetratricopeptide (TPR) repeat protein